MSQKRPPIDILTLMDSPILFGEWFTPRRTWFSWRVALAAAFGLPIERTGNPEAALKLFRRCTGRENWPTKQAKTVAFICGVRSGKLLSLDTPILTPGGFVRNGDISRGDTVFDEQGQRTRVLEVHDSFPERAYRLHFSDGSTLRAGGEHEWVTLSDEALTNLPTSNPVPTDWAKIPSSIGARLVTTDDIFSSPPDTHHIPSAPPSFDPSPLGIRSVVSSERIPLEPMRCLVVDAPNSMYLAGESLVPTHNSRTASLIAIYLACMRQYEKYLAPGERGVIPVIAADRKQARMVFNYASSFASGSEIFKQLLTDETKERLVFSHGIDLEVMTGSYKSVRGYSMVGAVLDEVAFYESEDAANPDHELLASVRRGTITIPDAMIVMISSPYARRGVLWETYKRSYGVEDPDTFVWVAPTWFMNLTLSRADLQPEYDLDPEKADADYGAKFRKGASRAIPIESIEACVDTDRGNLPPQKSIRYSAFVDPSGGGSDSMTLAIAHHENGRTVIDAVFEWIPPIALDSVVAEMAGILRQYNVKVVLGDRYGGDWPPERFAAHGITYDVAKKPKSDLYRELIPALNSQRVSLPDNPKLIQQLWNLQRRTTRGGRDSIDHPKGAHDDVANVVALASATLQTQPKIRLTW